MSSKKWCITFALSVILIATIYALFNILVDPFGVFGDRIFDWYSYNMTNNPRAAKIGYLEKNENYKNYDSYIIGCSSTSSFTVEDLNKYLYLVRKEIAKLIKYETEYRDCDFLGDKRGVLINGETKLVEITKERLEEVFNYLEENDEYLCNYTVNEAIKNFLTVWIE